jgi:hypothetical protein
MALDHVINDDFELALRIAISLLVNRFHKGGFIYWHLAKGLLNLHNR